MAAAKITLDQVTMAFGEKVVTENVDLEVREHELVCVVGTSGGGKTTLLRAIGGLLEPSEGEIRLDSEPIAGPTPRIAMIFQHFGLFPWKTVRKNIAYGLDVQARGAGSAVIDRLLDATGLRDSADAFPYQLSGGMQQRVGIARAFAVEPEVLLMDEPFSALDALTREELQAQLLELWAQHPELTAVLVTHDIDEAIMLGDRIVVLRGRPGRIDGEFAVPIERPRDPRELRSEPGYAELRRRVWDALRAQEEEAVA